MRKWRSAGVVRRLFIDFFFYADVVVVAGGSDAGSVMSRDSFGGIFVLEEVPGRGSREQLSFKTSLVE